jgi:hypothetical protein
MNIEEFFRKFPEKTINDYYSFVNENSAIDNLENKTSDTDETPLTIFFGDIIDQPDELNDRHENVPPIDINEEDYQIKSGRSTAFFWIVGGFILLLLISNLFSTSKNYLSQGEKLSEKAKRCLELRTSNRPVFQICQKNIREEAKNLDSIELEKYTSILLNDAGEEITNNSNDDFNFTKFVLNSIVFFAFVFYLAIIVLTFTFFNKIEPNFKYLKKIEKNLEKILLFYKSNPIIYKKFENFQAYAWTVGLFNVDRKYCYQKMISEVISQLVVNVILIALFIGFAIPYLSEILLNIEFTYPTVYFVLYILVYFLPIVFVISSLNSIRDGILNQIINIQNDFEHYIKMTSNERIRAFF